jgi:hypothetical protein
MEALAIIILSCSEGQRIIDNLQGVSGMSETEKTEVIAEVLNVMPNNCEGLVNFLDESTPR